MTTKEKRDIFSRKHITPETAAYLGALTAPDEGYAAHVTAAMEKDGVRGLSVSAMEGRVLETFARLSCARKAVEIGTLYGYSAHWLARGLPDGSRLYTLEKDPACVNAAKDGVEASSLSRKITVMEGPAADSLKTLAKLAPFDLCFIDAAPDDAPAYLRWAAANLRPGGVVLAGGVFLAGAQGGGDGGAAEGATRAMREFFHILFDGDRFVSASVLPAGEGLAAGIRA